MEKVNFGRYKLLPQKLTECGFERAGNGYKKSVPLLGGQFSLELSVNPDGAVETQLFDTASEEEYVLHLVEDCGGAFVAEVRGEYRAALEQLKENCYSAGFCKYRQTEALIAYVRERYGAQPEYLWEKTPDCFIFRRSENRKWFAAVLGVKRSRLGLSGDGDEEIVDLRADPEELKALIDNERYFPGYHMNKKHWFTVILNGNLSEKELFFRVDESFRIADK